jgi:copper chaperone CopZ
MRPKRFLVVMLFALGITFIQANDKVVKFETKSIHCESDAGKIKKTVTAVDGISDFEVKESDFSLAPPEALPKSTDIEEVNDLCPAWCSIDLPCSSPSITVYYCPCDGEIDFVSTIEDLVIYFCGTNQPSTFECSCGCEGGVIGGVIIWK